MENLLLLFDYETHFSVNRIKKSENKNHSFNNYQYGRKENSTC